MKKVKIVLALVVSILFHPTTLIGQFKIEQQMEEARQKLQAGELVAAASIAKRIIASSKKSEVPKKFLADAYSLAGNCSRRKGDLKEAIQLHLQAFHMRKTYYGDLSIEVSNSLHNMGNCYLEQQDLNSSRKYFQQALAIRQSHPEANLLIAQSINALGSYWNTRELADSALSYYWKATDLLAAHQMKDSQEYLSARVGIAEAFTLDKKFVKAIQAYQEALNIQKHKYPKGHPYTATILNNLANTHAKVGHYTVAIQLQNQAIEMNASLGNTKELIDSYVNLGNYLIETGDYKQALEQLQIAFYQAKKNPDSSPNGNLLSSLGLAYMYNSELGEAIRKHTEALNFYLQNKPEDPGLLAGAYLNIGNCCSEQKSWSAAIKNYSDALLIFDKIHSNLSAASCHGNIANCLIQLGQYEQATPHLSKAIALCSGYPRIKAQYYYALGFSQLERNQLDQAESNFKLAATFLDFNLKILKPEIISAPPTLALQLMGGLAQSAQKKYLIHKDFKHLDQALHYYRNARLYIKYLQRTYSNSQSRQRLVDQFYTIYEELIWCLYEKNQSETNTEAWQYAEESKAIMLSEVFRSTNAQKIVKIPDSLLQQEAKLNQQIGYLEKQQFLNSNPSLGLAEQGLAQLFDYKNQLLQFQQKIERIFPQFAKAKYTGKLSELSSIQDLLDKDQMILEYFWGEHQLFAFILTKDRLIFKKLPQTSDMEGNIINLVRMIRQSPGVGVPSKQQINEYVVSAQQLYQQLIASLQLQLSPRIIIIPDGPLDYLPFEVLLTKTPSNKTNIRKFPYFLLKHATSYCFSGELLQEMSKSIRNEQLNHKVSGNVLAIAPAFESNSFGFQPLLFHHEEVALLQGILPRVKTLNGKRATEAAFEQLAPKYRVVHLATHAQANLSAADYSYIAFTEQKDSIENEFLFTRELYGIPLHADLVVLSACETAYGQYKRGEGIISLARAFAYAGAQSLIATQWPIRDQKSPKITTLIYEALAKGKPKDVALQEAKIAFIQEGTQLNAFPYFWAAFTSIGNTQALDRSITAPFFEQRWFWMLVVIGLASLIQWWWRFRTKQKR